MCYLSLHRALVVAVIVSATAAPQHSKKQLHLLRTKAAKSKAPALNVAWFAEDAAKIAQMPPYTPDQKVKAHLPGDPMTCGQPSCFYSCGKRECDQSCEPLCLPPKCETLCSKSEDKCNTRCSKPKCAVLCPTALLQSADCPNGKCPKCRTLCAPPACTTSCSGSCHSVCTQPQCSWKCKAGNCPKPDCKMSCSGFHQCREKLDGNLTKVPLMPGMDIKAKAVASMDPTVLTQPAQAPPPEAAKTMPLTHSESSLGHQQVPSPKQAPSPVTALKMKWQAEDLVDQNDRLRR